MSLDLDADVLVSELAPVSALIQRMGRCYRRRVPDSGGSGEVLLYPPPADIPYERAELKQAAAFASQLAARSGRISQAELARLLAQLDVLSPAATDGFAAFLDAGMFASSREASFRDTDEYTVDAVLDSDVDAWIRANRDRDPSAQRYVLPCPRSLAARDLRLLNHLRTAPASHYDPVTGLHAQEVLHYG
jgi:CRISPR-associated endonuclease/helicase Cas3